MKPTKHAMKQISGLQMALISLASVMSVEPLQAQLTGLSIETVFEHDGDGPNQTDTPRIGSTPN